MNKRDDIRRRALERAETAGLERLASLRSKLMAQRTALDQILAGIDRATLTARPGMRADASAPLPSLSGLIDLAARRRTRSK